MKTLALIIGWWVILMAAAFAIYGVFAMIAEDADMARLIARISVVTLLLIGLFNLLDSAVEKWKAEQEAEKEANP